MCKELSHLEVVVGYICPPVYTPLSYGLAILIIGLRCILIQVLVVVFLQELSSMGNYSRRYYIASFGS